MSDIHLSPLEAQKLVEGIADDYGWLPNSVRDSTPDKSLKAISNLQKNLGAAARTLATDLYKSKARFVFELIQNAEDNSYIHSQVDPYIHFSIYPDKIIVENNEDGFKPANVQSICKIGASTKIRTNSEYYVGEKGIGFKSVFMVASKVYIHSGPFSFFFEHPSRTDASGMGMITPVHYTSDKTLEPPLTRLTLILRPDVDRTELENQFFRDLPNPLLLFLKELKQIVVNKYDSNGSLSRHTTYTCDCDDLNRRATLAQISQAGGSPPETSLTRYFTMKTTAFNLPIHEKRQYNTAEIILAFPVSGKDVPVIKQHDVYAYLPIETIGFPFLIQSDFITQASRQDVLDCPRNRALLDEIAQAFVDSILQFCKHPTLQYQWMRYLPKLRCERFWVHLLPKIQEILDKTPVLRSYGQMGLKLVRQLRIIPENFKDARGEPLLADSPEGTYLAFEYQKGEDTNILISLGLQSLKPFDVIARLKQDLASSSSRLKSKSTPIEWHTNMARFLLESFEGQYLSDLGTMKFIPLENGNFTSCQEGQVFFPDHEGTSVPNDLGLRLVYPGAIKNNIWRKKLFSAVGVIDAPVAHVRILIEGKYLDRNSRATLIFSQSLAHLQYLYHTHATSRDQSTKDHVRTLSMESSSARPFVAAAFAPAVETSDIPLGKKILQTPGRSQAPHRNFADSPKSQQGASENTSTGKAPFSGFVRSGYVPFGVPNTPSSNNSTPSTSTSLGNQATTSGSSTFCTSSFKGRQPASFSEIKPSSSSFKSASAAKIKIAPGTKQVPFRPTIEGDPRSCTGEKDCFQSICFQGFYQDFSHEELRLADGPQIKEFPRTDQVPFTPTIEYEENSYSGRMNALQSICFQNCYQSFSYEELRLADYSPFHLPVIMPRTREFEYDYLWVFGQTGTQTGLVSCRTELYFPSEEEFGVQQLLKPSAVGINPEFTVPYLNYFYLLPTLGTPPEIGSLTWEDWLHNELRILREPPLINPNAPARLSRIFRYLANHRPERFLGTLKKYWKSYEPLITPEIAAEISHVEVRCQNGENIELCNALLPVLESHAKKFLHVEEKAPFLVLYPESNPQEWMFLTKFGARATEDVAFYLSILRCVQKANERTEEMSAPERVFGLYDSIYRNLKNLPQNQTEMFDIHQRIDVCRPELNEAELDSVRDAFRNQNLIFCLSKGWYPSKECIWCEEAQIEGKVNLSSQYQDLREFFVDLLGVQVPDLEMFVNELKNVATSMQSVGLAKNLIWQINSRNPSANELAELQNYAIFPVKEGNKEPQLQKKDKDFAIVDREKLASTFKGPEVNGALATLDFPNIEDVRKLQPFLAACNIEHLYLSNLVEQRTSLTGEARGSIEPNQVLTLSLRRRAYALFRCIFHWQSPRTSNAIHSLYQLLFHTQVFTTNKIVTKLQVKQNGQKIQATLDKSMLHIIEDSSKLQVYVPQDRKDRELCYRRLLPAGLLATLMTRVGESPTKKPEASLVGIFADILNCSDLVINEILEDAGIVPVPFADEYIPEVVDNSHISSNPLLKYFDLEGYQAEIEYPGPQFTSSKLNTALVLHSAKIPGPSPRRSRPSVNESIASSSVDVDKSTQEYCKLLSRVIDAAKIKRGVFPRKGAFDVQDLLSALPVNSSEHSPNHDLPFSHKWLVAAGELYAFEILKLVEPPLRGFSEGCQKNPRNWTSTNRKYVTAHNDYREMKPWAGPETSGITYDDNPHGDFTKLLIENGYLDGEIWGTATPPNYFIEVKTTPRECDVPFFLEKNQYQRMYRMRLPAGKPAAEVYIIFWIFNLATDAIGMQLYVDPASMEGKELEFSPQSYSVVPRLNIK